MDWALGHIVLLLLGLQAPSAGAAGDYAEAERLQRIVAEETARIPGISPNEQARQFSNLASVLNLRGKADEALAFLLKAQDLMERQPNIDPAEFALLHLNLGRAYALRAQWAEAENEYRSGTTILNTTAGLDEDLSYDADAQLAYVYWKTHRFAQAKPLYERALRFFTEALGPDHRAVRQWQAEYQELLKDMPR